MLVQKEHTGCKEKNLCLHLSLHFVHTMFFSSQPGEFTYYKTRIADIFNVVCATDASS